MCTENDNYTTTLCLKNIPDIVSGRENIVEFS